MSMWTEFDKKVGELGAKVSDLDKLKDRLQGIPEKLAGIQTNLVSIQENSKKLHDKGTQDEIKKKVESLNKILERVSKTKEVTEPMINKLEEAVKTLENYATTKTENAELPIGLADMQLPAEKSVVNKSTAVQQAVPNTNTNTNADTNTNIVTPNITPRGSPLNTPEKKEPTTTPLDKNGRPMIPNTNKNSPRKFIPAPPAGKDGNQIVQTAASTPNLNESTLTGTEVVEAPQSGELKRVPSYAEMAAKTPNANVQRGPPASNTRSKTGPKLGGYYSSKKYSKRRPHKKAHKKSHKKATKKSHKKATKKSHKKAQKKNTKSRKLRK